MKIYKLNSHESGEAYFYSSKREAQKSKSSPYDEIEAIEFDCTKKGALFLLATLSIEA